MPLCYITRSTKLAARFEPGSGSPGLLLLPPDLPLPSGRSLVSFLQPFAPSAGLMAAVRAAPQPAPGRGGQLGEFNQQAISGFLDPSGS